MDNRIILTRDEKIKKQNAFFLSLHEKPRKLAKKALEKQIRQCFKATAEIQAHIIVSGINTHIYYFDFDDTREYFEKLQEIVKRMDFIINNEANRLVELSLTTTSKAIAYAEERDFNDRKKKADADFERKIKNLRKQKKEEGEKLIKKLIDIKENKKKE